MKMPGQVVGTVWALHSGIKLIWRHNGTEYWFDIAGRLHPVRWYRFPKYFI